MVGGGRVSGGGRRAARRRKELSPAAEYVKSDDDEDEEDDESEAYDDCGDEMNEGGGELENIQNLIEKMKKSSAGMFSSDMGRQLNDEINDLVRGEKPSATEMFPEALNRQLKTEVEALKYENARLKQTLQEMEKKEKLKTTEIPSPLRGLGRSSDLAASKIVELHKKVRELSAKLGTAETKASKAEAQLAVYLASQQASVKPEENNEPPEPSVLEAKDNQIKELTEKLNSTNNKLCESRNQVMSLRQEIRQLQKTLVNEIGDETLTGGTPSNWRGRAQQILSLQQKVCELTKRLSTTDIVSREKSALSLAVSEKHAEKEKVAALTKELDEIKEELAEVKNKGDAAKARIKVLSSELSTTKSTLQSLTMKSTNDDQMIASLTVRWDAVKSCTHEDISGALRKRQSMNQLANLTEKCREREDNVTKTLNGRITELSIELKQEKVKSEQLMAIIGEKDAKISKLESQMNTHTSLQPTNDPSHQLRPISRGSNDDRNSAITSPALNMSEAERMRLLELVAVLNKRVDEERRNLDRTMDELRRERQRGAKLETKVARLEMEKVGCTRGSYYKISTPKTGGGSAQSDFECLKDKCELLQEKCLALETRLATLKREKEDEARMYRDILEEARQTFREHVRPVKSACATFSLP